MAKSFHPGRAAQNGIMAALLAAEGFDAAPDAIEGRRGFAEVLSSAFAPERIEAGLGDAWEIMRNTYKPFACGLVIHPSSTSACSSGPGRASRLRRSRGCGCLCIRWCWT